MIRHTVAALIAALALALPPDAAALMNLRPGEAPPPFALPDLEGRQVKSADFAGDPAVVLFWSTWSPRSAEMLEDFKRHAATYGGKGLKIVAVNIDGESLQSAQKAAIREYATARALPFPVLLDEGLVTFSSWGVMAHPTEVVLERDGRIAYVLPGYPLSLREELEDAIKKVLGLSTAAKPEPTTSVGYIPQGMALQHFNLGRQLVAKGDLDKALSAFRRAAAADPAFLEAAVMLARVSLAAGDREPAEQLARQVSPDAVNRGDLRYLIGSLLLAKGELDAAERSFQELREQRPQEGWGAWGLGQVALARGDRAAALALFKDALVLQPANTEGEAFVRKHFRDRWMRRETTPEDDAFVAAFPELGEMRERFRNLFGAPKATANP